MTEMTLDQDQQMLADSARKFLQRSYREADRATATAHVIGCDPARWQQFAELGWLAVGVPEADGGLGSPLGDVCALAEELGRALVVEPFIASVVLSGMLFADSAGPELRALWLPAMAEGTKRVAFFPWDRGQRYDAFSMQTSAKECEGAWRLAGDKSLAPGGAGADGFIVAASDDSGSFGLYLIAADAGGVHVTNHRLYDGRHAARLALRDAPATLLMRGGEDTVKAVVTKALDRATIAHCAETVGAMAAAFELTREYLCGRRQFGKAIASNQVVQHRLVDWYVELEEARALVRMAAAQPERRLAAATAAFTTQAAHHAWEEAIQLHGAIGMTDEYAIGAYVRRLALATSLYGDVHHHLGQLATMSLGEIA